jgi:hypothetical protein
LAGAGCRRAPSIAGAGGAAGAGPGGPAGVAARRWAVPPAPATAASRATPVRPRGKAIAILYSSNLLGEYEPCG